MKQIPLTKGKVAIVDDEDFERVSRHKWLASRGARTWYAHATEMQVVDGSKKRVTLAMHRIVLSPLPWQIVDHVNHDGLDNRRQNLRTCFKGENIANAPKKRTPYSSKFKGVNWKKQQQRWVAQITAGRRVIHLGLYATEEDAAKAYDRAAIQYFGEFACLNFPETVNPAA